MYIHLSSPPPYHITSSASLSLPHIILCPLTYPPLSHFIPFSITSSHLYCIVFQIISPSLTPPPHYLIFSSLSSSSLPHFILSPHSHPLSFTSSISPSPPRLTTIILPHHLRILHPPLHLLILYPTSPPPTQTPPHSSLYLTIYPTLNLTRPVRSFLLCLMPCSACHISSPTQTLIFIRGKSYVNSNDRLENEITVL